MAAFADLLLAQLSALVTPLVDAARDIEEVEADDPNDPPEIIHVGLIEMLESAGMEDLIGAEVTDALPMLSSQIVAAAQRIETLTAGQADASDVMDTVFAVTDALATLDRSITQLRSELDTSPFANDLPERIVTRLWHWLLWRRIENAGAAWMPLAELTGVVQPPDDEVPVAIDLAPLRGLVSDPQAVFAASFGWGTTDIDGAFVLEQLYDLARAAQLDADVRERDVGGATVDALHITLVEPSVSPTGAVTTSAEGGIWIAAGAAPASSGIVFGFWGTATPMVSQAFGDGTTLTVSAEASATDLPMVALSPDGPQIASPNTPGVDGTVTLAMRHAPQDPVTLIPLGPFGAVISDAIHSQAQLSADGSLAARVAVEDGRATLVLPGSDGLLSQLLPPEGFDIPFNIAALWNSGAGFVIEGSADLSFDLPVGLDLFKALKIDTLHVTVPLVPVDGPQMTIAASVGARLGPVDVTVSKIGITLEGQITDDDRPHSIRADDGSLSLRVGDVAIAAGFKRPDGLGLSLDMGAVKGGGFLEIGEARYSGALFVETPVVGLSAFGVLTTELPDGSNGFSLLAFVRGEFTPIELGFGFTLNSVGGIFGIHRGIDPDALFAAVRAGQIGNLLAPEDPVRDAATLIPLAEGVFPTTKGQHVFGPTLQLGWGKPEPLITLDLALALSLPDPLRILVMGRVQAVLPNKRIPVVLLNMDVAGLLDLSASTLDVEGRLFDSHYTKIPLTGGFALKMAWGADKAFVFSIGGLHPGFAPPTGFPVVPRVGLDLSTSVNFVLKLEAYLALTSNTLQFGAAVDLSTRIKGYGLECHAGFDALIIFDPFALDAHLRASARIFKGQRTLMRLALQARLRGPGPWTINGSVTFEILWVDVSLSVSERFGAAITSDVETVDVGPLLDAALSDPQNWASTGDDARVVLAASSDGVIVPSATLAVSQSIVPLGVPMDHFGGRRISGPNRFDVTGMRLDQTGDLTIAPAPQEDFAPGSFRTLSDADKLIAPAFAPQDAGVAADSSEAVVTGSIADRNIGRRVLRIDQNGPGGASVTQNQDAWTAPDVALDDRMTQTMRGRIRVRPETWMAGDAGETLGPATSHWAAQVSAAQGRVVRAAEA